MFEGGIWHTFRSIAGTALVIAIVLALLGLLRSHSIPMAIVWFAVGSAVVLAFCELMYWRGR